MNYKHMKNISFVDILISRAKEVVLLMLGLLIIVSVALTAGTLFSMWGENNISFGFGVATLVGAFLGSTLSWIFLLRQNSLVNDLRSHRFLSSGSETHDSTTDIIAMLSQNQSEILAMKDSTKDALVLIGSQQSTNAQEIELLKSILIENQTNMLELKNSMAETSQYIKQQSTNQFGYSRMPSLVQPESSTNPKRFTILKGQATGIMAEAAIRNKEAVRVVRTGLQVPFGGNKKKTVSATIQNNPSELGSLSAYVTKKKAVVGVLRADENGNLVFVTQDGDTNDT